jgi:hypothetical protein
VIRCPHTGQKRTLIPCPTTSLQAQVPRRLRTGGAFSCDTALSWTDLQIVSNPEDGPTLRIEAYLDRDTIRNWPEGDRGIWAKGQRLPVQPHRAAGR